MARKTFILIRSVHTLVVLPLCVGSIGMETPEYVASGDELQWKLVKERNRMDLVDCDKLIRAKGSASRQEVSRAPAGRKPDLISSFGRMMFDCVKYRNTNKTYLQPHILPYHQSQGQQWQKTTIIHTV